MNTEFVLPLFFAGVMLLMWPFTRALKRVRDERLKFYWKRPCQGARWKRRFPAVARGEIRAFLTTFTEEAFGFRRERRLCFTPDDKVLDVYRAVYPPGEWGGDFLILETLVFSLEKTHGVSVRSSWWEDITLGELFTLVHPHRP